MDAVFPVSDYCTVVSTVRAQADAREVSGSNLIPLLAADRVQGFTSVALIPGHLQLPMAPSMIIYQIHIYRTARGLTLVDSCRRCCSASMTQRTHFQTHYQCGLIPWKLSKQLTYLYCTWQLTTI